MSCTWRATDLAVAGSAAEVVRNVVEHRGGLDMLVTNAGRSTPATSATPADDWIASYRLNFLGNLDAVDEAVPVMAARGWGRVVTVMGTAYRAPDQHEQLVLALWSTGTPPRSVCDGRFEVDLVAGPEELGTAVRSDRIDVVWVDVDAIVDSTDLGFVRWADGLTARRATLRRNHR